MKRHSWPIASLWLCLVMQVAVGAQATGGIRSNWKSRYPAACSTLRTAADQCLLCHTSGNADIDNLNPYGTLLMDNNRNFAAAEPLDSDGDGRTNLEEIQTDCTLPGDLTSPTSDWMWGTLKATYR